VSLATRLLPGRGARGHEVSPGKDTAFGGGCSSGAFGAVPCGPAFGGFVKERLW